MRTCLLASVHQTNVRSSVGAGVPCPSLPCLSFLLFVELTIALCRSRVVLAAFPVNAMTFFAYECSMVLLAPILDGNGDA